jgi:hypothetical protein
MPRRFPPPWSIEERQESFIVKDANGQQIAYLYFEDEPQRQMSMKRLSRDEAFLLAVNIAKLPSVPRQILKDIPRPPNSASHDDRMAVVSLLLLSHNDVASTGGNITGAGHDPDHSEDFRRYSCSHRILACCAAVCGARRVHCERRHW